MDEIEIVLDEDAGIGLESYIKEIEGNAKIKIAKSGKMKIKVKYK